MPHKDPEVAKQYFRDHYKKNKARRRAEQKKYREENREAINARTRELRAKAPEKQRNQRLRHKYGMTQDEYDRMAKAQNHRCAVCDVQPTGKLVVDHCHDKGHVRGLLCHNCNLALGHLKDDIKTAQAAVKYLTENQFGSNHTVEEVKA